MYARRSSPEGWNDRDGGEAIRLLSSAVVLTPEFSVPDDINERGEADKVYRYRVTMTADGVEQAREDVTVTALEKPNIRCASRGPILVRRVPPGSIHRFNPCPGGFRGAPSGSEYVLKWRGIETAVLTPEEILEQLDRTDVASPLFTAPTVAPYTNFRVVLHIQANGLGRECRSRYAR